MFDSANKENIKHNESTTIQRLQIESLIRRLHMMTAPYYTYDGVDDPEGSKYCQVLHK